jgi:hypothetical protein
MIFFAVEIFVDFYKLCHSVLLTRFFISCLAYLLRMVSHEEINYHTCIRRTDYYLSFVICVVGTFNLFHSYIVINMTNNRAEYKNIDDQSQTGTESIYTNPVFDEVTLVLTLKNTLFVLLFEG